MKAGEETDGGAELARTTRLFAILAREAPVAVVFRRGPSKQVQLLRWDLATDRVEPGQWFNGRIYERRCDLSPSGRLLIYFAAKYRRARSFFSWQGAGHPPSFYSWTAVSRPPFFTALALWPKVDTWGGGGAFADETHKARFDAKMHPLQYRRPQAPPRAGNIAQAERLFALLGLEPALRRRFARLEEVPTVWRPAAAVADAETAPSARTTSAGSIFAHLKANKADAPDSPLAMPPQAVTWAKFRRDVLPDAHRMSVWTAAKMSFCGLVTAVDAQAPPLLQWDRMEARNPVSWYIYVNGSAPARWSLPTGEWVAVTGITLLPSLWSGGDRYRHHFSGAVLVLDGAQDQSVSSLSLFPETLRSELHGVRAVIEAYSKSRRIEGADAGSANGLLVGQGGDHAVRVESAIGTACYTIDRWE